VGGPNIGPTVAMLKWIAFAWSLGALSLADSRGSFRCGCLEFIAAALKAQITAISSMVTLTI